MVTVVAMTAATSAQTVAEPDTIAVLSDASRVSVTRTDTNTVITVTGADNAPDAYYEFTADHGTPVTDMLSLKDPDWSPAFPFTSSRRRHSVYKTTWFANTVVGASVPLSASAGMQASFEGGFMSVVAANWQPWRQGPTLSVGAGLLLKMFAVGDGMRFECDGRHLMLVPVGDGVRDYGSRLQMFSFTVPVTLRQNIYRLFGVTLGAVINFNSYAKAGTHYTTADNCRYDATFKGLHQRLVTVDLMAAAGYDDVGVYVRYSPSRLFSDGWGPRMRSLSVGLILAF